MAELKRVLGRLSQNHLDTLMAYADRMQIAGLSFQIGNSMHKRDGQWHVDSTPMIDRLADG